MKTEQEEKFMTDEKPIKLELTEDEIDIVISAIDSVVREWGTFPPLDWETKRYELQSKIRKQAGWPEPEY